MRFRLVVALLLVALIPGVIYLARTSAGASPPNVILISLDTCRADHLACYGYPKPTTPAIDAVARHAVRFTHAVSTVPLTLPAHCSIMTGLIPPAHGVHDNLNYRLADRTVTLAETLRSHGYTTAAIIGAFVLDAQTGINQGFDVFDDHLTAGGAAAGRRPERRAEVVSRLAMRWLEDHPKEPFFLFLHYYDPHDPYDSPEPFASAFPDDAYAGEIAYADRHIGHVIDALKRLERYDDSLVIIVGDHGESLSEHGEATHGYFVYNATTRVPLIVKPPGGREPTTVETAVSLADVMPTILSLVDVPIPSNLQGESLAAQIRGHGRSAPDRFVYAESMLATKYGCAPLFSIEDAAWNYIQAPTPELYFLPDDPDESSNVLDAHRPRAATMKRRLKALLAGMPKTRSGESRLDMDPESRQRLETLGYAGGGVVETFDFDAEREDPKDFAEIHNELERMDRLMQDKDFAEAVRIGRRILALRPGLADAHRRLAMIALEQRDAPAATEHYTAALAAAPNDRDAPLWHNNLGILLARKGRFEEAAGHFQAALRLVGATDESNGDGTGRAKRGARGLIMSANMNLGELRLRQGRLAEAADHFQNVVDEDAANAAALYKLGEVLSALGRTEEADDARRRAGRIQEQRPDAGPP